MVSQGSLCEEDGILPNWPGVWDSDHAIPRSPDSEEFSPVEDSSSDEDLMYEISSSPKFKRLQRVAIRHKHRVYGVQMDLARESGNVSRLELQSHEQAERISELSAFTVQLAIERDEAKKLARRWKICNCILGVIVLACPGCRRFRRSGLDPKASVLWEDVFRRHQPRLDELVMAGILDEPAVIDASSGEPTSDEDDEYDIDEDEK